MNNETTITLLSSQPFKKGDKIIIQDEKRKIKSVNNTCITLYNKTIIRRFMDWLKRKVL